LNVQRVAFLRPIDGYDGDGSAPFDQNGLVITQLSFSCS